MNGYLVIARCQHEDIPIGLYSTAEEAIEHMYDEPNDAIRRQWNTYEHQYVCVHIVVFVDGIPVSTRVFQPAADLFDPKGDRPKWQCLDDGDEDSAEDTSAGV